MRMAGQTWFPPANQQGEGCAKKPEKYPAPIKPTMSHGNPQTTIFPRSAMYCLKIWRSNYKDYADYATYYKLQK